MGVALLASAQTPGASNNIKFQRVASPVPKQTAVGGQQAGEFYHSQYTGAAWGDYNNDGYLDVYYSDRNTHVSSTNTQSNLYRNAGNGTFTRVAWPPFAATAFSTPVWFDFNNDGLLDMFISGVSSWGYRWDDDKTNLDLPKCHLYIAKSIEADGSVSYEEISNCGVRPVFNGLSGGKGHMAAAAGDFDKDGYTDIILTGFDEPARRDTETPHLAIRTCKLYRNIKGERFELVEAPLANGNQFEGLCDGSVTMVDLDGDSWLDIVANGYDTKYESSLHVYWNNGDGTFTEKETGVKGLTAGITAVGDLNNDGRPDLVMGGIYENTNGKKLYIAQNMGNREWQLVTPSTFEGIDGAQISIGDVNQDGLVDLLVGGHGQQHEHTTWLYANQGNFEFTPVYAQYQDTFGKLGHFNRVTHGNQHLIDFDNDGYLDAWSSGWCNGTCGSGCLTEIYRNVSSNKGVVANVAPSVPASLSASIDENGVATFTWVASTDDFTPEAALRYNFYLKLQGGEETFMVLPADLATGFVRVGNTTGAIYGCSFKTCIAQSGTYEWGVQAIDGGNRGGAWATSLSTFEVSGIDDVNTTTTGGKAWAAGKTINYSTVSNSTLTVYKADGKVVEQALVDGNGSLNVDEAGIYVVSLTGNGYTYTTKVIIR